MLTFGLCPLNDRLPKGTLRFHLIRIRDIRTTPDGAHRSGIEIHKHKIGGDRYATFAATESTSHALPATERRSPDDHETHRQFSNRDSGSIHGHRCGNSGPRSVRSLVRPADVVFRRYGRRRLLSRSRWIPKTLPCLASSREGDGLESNQCHSLN